MWLLHDPHEFAYYIAENWILSAWANYCLSVDIPRAAWGSEQTGGRAFKTAFEDNVIFHLPDKDMSYNVSLFWTLSIFFLPLLHSLVRGTKINPASYYCWLRRGKRVGSYSLWFLSNRLQGSALILTMLADVKALRLGAVRWHAFTPVVQYLLVF